jgi:Domain of unknown function (DUF5666)
LVPATSRLPRLTRVVVLAVTGAAALSVAACGSSNTANTSSPTTSPSSTTSPPATSQTTSPPPANGQAHVSGLIASVSGNAIQVTQQENGSATVDFTPSTKVAEVTPAGLPDVATGSCVSVRPGHEESQGGQPITAATVRIHLAVDGKCPQAKPAKRSTVDGSVASVAGNTITVTSTDASGNTSQTAVSVNDKTKYSKQASATSQAITAGKCIAAWGSKDGSGTLQATTVDLRPANDGKCGGHGRHAQGG